MCSIENVWRKFIERGEIWYHNYPPNHIDSFSMLVDSFVKSHAGAIKAATRKSDLFKLRKKDNKMLREFVFWFQMERIDVHRPQMIGLFKLLLKV